MRSNITISGVSVFSCVPTAAISRAKALGAVTDQSTRRTIGDDGNDMGCTNWN
ncbi:hypothetical protein [Allocoleopsis sp.]|uniref:hypothetical protein n=1 Tax=Allocoleopsis sp. TaxID=3088169 RepID=UPI002FD1DB40